MARTSGNPTTITPTAGFELGMEFLRARRAQNLSFMRLVEQSCTSMADLQRTAGGAGSTFARLWTSQAALVRDTAGVYRSLTTHLAR